MPDHMPPPVRSMRGASGLRWAAASVLGLVVVTGTLGLSHAAATPPSAPRPAAGGPIFPAAVAAVTVPAIPAPAPQAPRLASDTGAAVGTPTVAAVATSARPTVAASAPTFTDHADGYAVTPPAGWTFDPSLLPDVARWNTADASLRIYAQPVANAAAATTYVDYSNRSVDEQWNGMRLLALRHSGTSWFQSWVRPAMPLMRPDMREYAEWDWLMGDGEVLTVMVNATEPDFAAAYAAATNAVRSVRPVARYGRSAYALPHTPARPAPLVPAAPGLAWGVYEPAVNPEAPSLAAVDQLQKELGANLRVVMVYLSIGQPFPAALLRKAQAQGKVVEVTLQSWAPGNNAGRALPYANGTSNLAAILQGRDDAYLRTFARQAAATGIPFLFRWDNEMNGDWDPWSAFQWGKDADIYVAAYRHVHDIFMAEGATDAAFVWNPNNANLPHYRWNAAALYYPGNAYVDWIGLTGYNLGAGQPGSTWQSFRQAYAATYARDRALYPGKPMIITEFASNDAGGNKPAWIADMFRALPSFPAIRYAVWWDANQGDLQYALDQPPAALAAFGRLLRAGGGG